MRIDTPKIAITIAAAICYMFRAHQEKAGVHRHPFDGKGFHGLRRRLARKLLVAVAGTPLTTIIQILGHSAPKAVRQYLSLNTDNLKECALDLREISVKRGGAVMNREFQSRFSVDQENMIDLKVSLKYSAWTYIFPAKKFDSFCVQQFPESYELTKAVAFRWIKEAYLLGRIPEAGRWCFHWCPVTKGE